VSPPKSKKPDLKRQREEAVAAVRPKELPPDPLSPQGLKKLGIRLGIPLAAAWIAVLFATNVLWPKIALGVLTLALGGLVVWVLRFANKSREVAKLVKEAETPEARKEAIEKLEGAADKGESAAIFAKAQLEMQEDPRKALKTLERINLSKVLATTADEARGQRAMIHLILGETDSARSLADHVDLARNKEPKTQAMLAAIVGEAFARTGAAKKAIEMLGTFDPDDAAFAELKPQLLRARAFAYAWANDTKQMKATLRKLSAMNPQYLSGFITSKKHPGGVPPKGVHPLLEKEAFDIISKSGAVQRKMEFRRS
jgi:hypothetical protein